MNTTKLDLTVKHNHECPDDCGATKANWYVADGGDGRFYIILTHDTMSFDADGEEIGYGARWQDTGADFATETEAEAALAEARK